LETCRKSIKRARISHYHIVAQNKWLNLRKSLECNTTIDANFQNNINSEKERWRDVLKRIISCIQFLAENNDSFRGKNSKLYTKNNGKLLGLIQIIAKFDPIMAEHLRKISSNEIHDHYLGPNMQNELISIMAKEIRKEIIDRRKINTIVFN
jgi:hypothetical protein